MLIVNGIFVYFALATFSGGDTSNPYRKGLALQRDAGGRRATGRARLADRVGYDDQAGRLSVSRARPARRRRVTGLAPRRCGEPAGDDKEDRRSA